MPYTLVIPTATIVTNELQRIGKLPTVIYPIGNKIVFDYIMQQFQGDLSCINVVCYEQASRVEEQLSGYKDERICIRKLTELNDLGHTVYLGLESVQGEVVINFGDTIVLDKNPNFREDAFYYAVDQMSARWTYYEEKAGVIKDIYDKSAIFQSEIKRPLFVGVFGLSDAQEFRRCLEKAFKNPIAGISSFYQAIMLYSKIHSLTPVRAKKWIDSGHFGNYLDSDTEVKAREFNHISIDKRRGILKKTSDDKDKFRGEILWYLKLPIDLEYARPRIFSYSTAYRDMYISMEYYTYHTLHELFLYGELSEQQWIGILERIRLTCEDFRKYTVTGENILPSLEAMYYTKTMQRLEKLKDKKAFRYFFEQDMCINGKMYMSLEDLLPVLRKSIPRFLYDTASFSIIHGDMCFSNILIDDHFSSIKLIDPRGRFGEYDIYGDCRYEYAKLAHSMDGKYDFIIKDMFQIQYDAPKAKIEFAIAERQKNYDVYQLFLTVFEKEIAQDRKKIELIEALLFLSMIPLHSESENRQFAMLATGMEILNRVIPIER